MERTPNDVEELNQKLKKPVCKFVKQKGTVMVYKEVHLDDSILDIDSWLPENAIDNIVQLIEQQLLNTLKE